MRKCRGLRVPPERHAVERIQADGQQQAAARGFADAGQRVTRQPRAVLQRPAIRPLAQMCGQQLVDQVAVAHLQVYGVKPDFPGHPRPVGLEPDAGAQPLCLPLQFLQRMFTPEAE